MATINEPYSVTYGGTGVTGLTRGLVTRPPQGAARSRFMVKDKMKDCQRKILMVHFFRTWSQFTVGVLRLSRFVEC